MPIYMPIYILTIDGSVFESKEKTLSEAITKLCGNDNEEFLQEINIVEWKDSKNRIVKNYMTGKIELFPLHSDYKLKHHLKIKPIKKPVKELEEEFEL